MSEDRVLAHVCPVCGAEVNEPCVTPYGRGTHAGRYSIANLPTLDEIVRGAKLRAALDAAFRETS